MTEDEQLESAARLTAAIDSFRRTAMEIKAQRDELLAACHAMCRVIAHEPEPTLKAALLIAYEQMKAAINRAEGADHA